MSDLELIIFTGTSPCNCEVVRGSEIMHVLVEERSLACILVSLDEIQREMKRDFISQQGQLVFESEYM